MLICGVLICSFLIWFCATYVLTFSVLMRFDVFIGFLFSFNKITDFHFDFSFHFVFENSSWNLNVLLVFFSFIDQVVVDFYMRNGRIVYPSVSLAYSRLSNFCRIL